LTLRTVLLSIQALMAAPEPKDPQDAVVAKQFLDSPALFKATARFWCQFFANGKGEMDAQMSKKLNTMIDMGVSKENAVASLSCNGWDVARATEYIFS